MTTLLDHARRELGLAQRAADLTEANLHRRQAAEKTWGHILDSTDELLGLPDTGPQARSARIDRLAYLDRQARTKLMDRYLLLPDRLHGDCFYAGRWRPCARWRGGTPACRHCWKGRV